MSSSESKNPYFEINKLSHGEPVKTASDIRGIIRPGTIQRHI